MRKAIYKRIDQVRAKQNQKHPLPMGFPKGLRMEILVEEVGEVARALLERDPESLKAELVDVAAVAVRWLEILALEQVETP